MLKKIIPSGVCLLLLLALVASCKRSNPSTRHNPGDYFQTHFQDESQFIVETIAADVAEQIYFAKFHKLPEASVFSATASETAESQFGAPTYDLLVDLDAKHKGLKIKLNINGPIWSPEVYDALTALLAKAVGLTTGESDVSNDTKLLAKLTDGEATTIEQENQNVSAALESDFTNPKLHEQAVLLLGAFMLREHSGYFSEIRSPLCRMTSHLALARFFQGGEINSVNGQIAGVLLLSLMNNQTDALASLNSIKASNAAVTSWVRALTARNSADYRPLEQLGGLSPVECTEWFYALTRSANADIAWSKLNDVQKKNVNFVRIASQGNFSVGMGHELLAVALGLEFEEVGTIHESVRSEKLKKEKLEAALNEMPERAISADTKNAIHVHVIGWGLWAGFLQRQLCHAVWVDSNFLQWKWGVPDEAKKFSAQSDALLSGLRLYPFVRRFKSTDVETYHQSVDDGFKVTVATPQLVSPQCWNYLCYNLSTGESYQPNPNPHVNEWHKHNPPPGTAYYLYPRLNHPSLTSRADAEAIFDQLHSRAPNDPDLNYYLMENRFKNAPTYAQATKFFGASAEYNIQAMTWLAWAVKGEPDKYEVLMNKAAEVNPAEFGRLGNYFSERNQDDKAAKYYEKNYVNPDSVAVSYHCGWLVHYYLKKGRVEDARRAADFGGEVYSFVGLKAKAEFLEAVKDYADAFDWYQKIEERYDDSGPLVSFCTRYKTLTGDTRYDDQIAKKTIKAFPNGFEKVRLADFSAAPNDGVLFKENSELLQAAGLKSGEVIVAIYNTRVHNQAQYEYLRDNNTNPELVLIVWQGDGYHEVKASPPEHRFGVDIGTYRKK